MFILDPTYKVYSFQRPLLTGCNVSPSPAVLANGPNHKPVNRCACTLMQEPKS